MRNDESLSTPWPGDSGPELTGWEHRSRLLRGDVVGERWPTLGRAMSQYEGNTAEAFSREAYEAVESGGIIRHEQRRLLAARAEELGIRSFDAQLLIACAIRKWVMDHGYESKPSPKAPALSWEYRAWRRWSVRIALVVALALALDGIILWKWLS